MALPPLLLLHGFTGTGEAMEPLASLLRASFEVVAPDLPGHGPNWSEEDDVDFSITGTAKQLHDLMGHEEPFDLVGYSMGGRVALQLARDFPDSIRRLVLISASPGIVTLDDRKQRLEADARLAADLREKGIQWFVNHWASLPMWETQVNLPGSLRMSQRWARLSNSAEGLARSLEGAGQGSMTPLWDQLPELDLPVDLIAGDLDSPYSKVTLSMAEKLPNARSHLIPEVGHAVHLENPKAVADIVLGERI